MARVLLVANSSWNFQNFRAGLIKELIRRGHEVTTVSPDLDGIMVGKIQVKHRTCRMHRSGKNPLKDVSSILQLSRIIHEERPDIFFGFTIKPNIYGSALCRMFKVPAVPNVTGLGTAFLGSSSLRRAVLLLYRFAFAGAKAVFFQNADDEKLFVEEAVVRPGQARILPGSGIDLDYFSPGPLPKDLRFLMIGRLLADKGVREYVGAARKLKSQFPSATFSLLGEVDNHNHSAIDRRELDRWVAEGSIDYLGTATDVRPFIADSTAIVLPSYREGLPRTLLEGAAMGRPLIGTDVPGCRELVRDGVTGFLCKARSMDSLAAAIEKMASASDDERDSMGAHARAMAEREFDEALVFDAYLEQIGQIDPRRQ